MKQDKDDIRELEKRIEKLKSKQKEEKDHQEFSPFVGGIQVAIELISGVIVGGAIGYIIKEAFDLGKVFLIIMIIMGGIAGFLNVIRGVNSDASKNIRK
ncbi:MAG: AtpZ/AtpI family protein [Alphaproteobacteria bacterium]|jgi:ATP synthase protein I|nr:AtpZ/AtpI family protein [Alphaproteobacteria bacterium]